MRETRADTVRALSLAVGLHLLLAALVFVGLNWVRESVDPAGGGPVVEAEMVDAGALSTRMQRALANREAAEVPVEPLPAAIEAEEDVPPLPQPVPEPKPQDAQTAPQPQPQQPQAEPDTRDQEAARREAINRETAAREQEAKRRQEQIELQRQQQQQAEQQRRLAAQQQREADARAKAEAESKAKAEREARAKQLADARAQQQRDAEARAANRGGASNPGPATGVGQGRDPRAEWLALVVDEIEKKWRRPDDIPRGQRCPIRIKLLPGGEVLSAEVQPSCPYSEPNRRSVEAAVMSASPLPLTGNENLALRDFVVNFYPSR